MGKIIRIIKKIFKRQAAKSVFTNTIIKNSLLTCGDFTYGKPIIKSWDNNTKLKIGKFCSIAANVRFFLGGNHRVDWISTYPFSEFKEEFNLDYEIQGHPATKGDITVGNDVWIGNDCIILSGVTIHDGAVIGAGSVISKDVGPFEIWGGNPARLIKKRFQDNEIEMLLKIKWWDWDIQKIKENIPLLCSTEIINFIQKESIT